MKTKLINLINNIKDKRAVKPLRYRLTASFIIFAFLLMGILWLMQAVFLGKYYEYSMEKKCEGAVNSVKSLYSNTESLSYDDFCSVLGTVSNANDVYFYVEAADGSFYISSTDETGQGRSFLNSRSLIQSAKQELVFGGKDSVQITSERDHGTGVRTLVSATIVSSNYRAPVYIFAIASLTPIGPAVGIIRSQLFIVTIISLVLGVLLARFNSKRLATPILDIGEQSKSLAKGNYDVHFEGGHVYQEMDELAHTLNDTAAELKASDALQKDLMANVSHDLRTPLTMIKSYAEMIKDISGDVKEKRDEHLDVIIEETDRLGDLVGDILMLSRMQSGVLEMQNESFDMVQAAENVFQTYKVMENEGFTMIFEKPDNPIYVTGDERKIQQVISNLVSNAIRYSEDDKYVELCVREEDEAGGGSSVRISVTDHGIGVQESDREKIWDRYQKASAMGTRSVQGTGLGLSIAGEILKLHNAKYGMQSEIGRGSRFWFKLPVEK